MNLLFAFKKHTGVRIAEIGFLLMLFAGIWFAAGQTRMFGRGRTVVAGLALALGALLLIIATHWGRFG